MVYGTTIQNIGSSATINSGNAIWIPQVRFTPSTQRSNRYNSVEGKNDIVEPIQGPVENKIISVEGVIDLNNTSGTTTVNGLSATTISEVLMIQMLWLNQTANSYLELKSAYGTQGQYILGRGASGYPATSDGILVCLDEYTLDPNVEAKNNHIINFTMKFHEVLRPS